MNTVSVGVDLTISDFGLDLTMRLGPATGAVDLKSMPSDLAFASAA